MDEQTKNDVQNKKILGRKMFLFFFWFFFLSIYSVQQSQVAVMSDLTLIHHVSCSICFIANLCQAFVLLNTDEANSKFGTGKLQKFHVCKSGILDAKKSAKGNNE